MENKQVISFENGVASVKDGVVINEMKLRECDVYAKLMLSKGSKFDPKKTKLSQFLQSEKKDYIRAELFIIGKKGQVITDSRMFINVAIKDIDIKQANHFWFVELIHPKLDVESCETVKFTK